MATSSPPRWRAARRDTGSDGIDFHLARLRNGRKRDHNADDRAEQPEVRTARDADRQKDELAVELLHFAHETALEAGPDGLDRPRGEALFLSSLMRWLISCDPM